tara:strand:- start:1091 stop:1294 length:204 start_codon:yes stop_codon:yes gene_type:complete
MINLFFFGTLPLGWKRFFRAISFVWIALWLINRGEEIFRFVDILLIVFGVPIILSYAISGFFGKKTD